MASIKLHFSIHIDNATKAQNPTFIKLTGYRGDDLETLFTPYENVLFADYCREWGKSQRYQCMLNSSDINITSKNVLMNQNIDYKLQLFNVDNDLIAESLPTLNGKQVSIKVLEINDDDMHILIENPINDPAYYRLLYREHENDINWTMVSDWNRLKKIIGFPLTMQLGFQHDFELPHHGQLWLISDTECSFIWNVSEHADADNYNINDTPIAGHAETINNSDCCSPKRDHAINVMHGKHHSFDTDLLC